MIPWLFPWSNLYTLPLSGNVAQDIAPVTSWFSPQFEFNLAGDRQIEAEVVADVASYGKQLGIISEALLEIADNKKGEAVARLKTLVSQIEEVKRHHKADLEQKAKSALEQLRKADPELLDRVLDEYRSL